ncbi:porin [Microvirga sp. W0021]|uniref:Porin n=1 Tax=Hohaiivirga grylli TaxID=3133970 RepID=A0ABV0BI54_9HYPH
MFKHGLLLSLSSATALAGFSAYAADLPAVKSAPGEYVRVCSNHGQGFFYIPGSDTCVQISGRVNAETVVQQSYKRNSDSMGFGALTRFNLDVRTNTPYGMARAYLRYQLIHGDAAWLNSGTHTMGTGTGKGASLEYAYIQFAGLTAGRIQSFFDFYANNYNYTPIRSSDAKTQALGYTFNFGNGWSLTAAIEDGEERRMYKKFTGVAYDGDYKYTYTNVGYDSAGQSAPDFVGSLMVNQSWGGAQLAAALHQVRPSYSRYAGRVDDPVTNTRDTKYGYAVKGAVKLNLPFIAAGDELWAEVAYTEGALSYIGASNYAFHENVNIPIADAVMGANGSIKKTKGWSAMIDLLHYWTPSIRQNVYASYMKIDYDRNGSSVFNDAVLGNYNVGFVDTAEWRVGSNLIWSPIKDFDIGIEVVYTRTDPKGRVLSYNNGYAKTISSEDQWQGPSA